MIVGTCSGPRMSSIWDTKYLNTCNWGMWQSQSPFGNAQVTSTYRPFIAILGMVLGGDLGQLQPSLQTCQGGTLQPIVRSNWQGGNNPNHWGYLILFAGKTSGQESAIFVLVVEPHFIHITTLKFQQPPKIDRTAIYHSFRTGYTRGFACLELWAKRSDCSAEFLERRVDV